MQLPKVPKSFAWVGLLTILAIISYYWFSNTPLFNNLLIWSKENFWLFLFIITLYKFISIIYPPLVGGVVTIAAVPIIGWESAFVADALGSTIGGIFNYHLAKKYGISVIRKMFGESWALKVEKIKIKKGKEIESLAVIRILSGSVVLEAIHYAAGILKIDFKKYLFAMIVTQITLGIPLFYLTSVVTKGNFLWTAIALAIFIPILYKLRGRYFEIVE